MPHRDDKSFIGLFCKQCDSMVLSILFKAIYSVCWLEIFNQLTVGFTPLS